MTNPELSDFERLVLTELFIWSQSSDSVVSIESIKQMLEDGGEEASAREISLALGLLRRLDLVKRYDSSANREKKFWAISNAGQSNVFDTNKKTPLLKANAKATAGQEISNPQAVHSTLYVPAADRYVAAQDNQPAIAEMRKSVRDIVKTIQEDRTNDFDDKEGRLAELLALDLLLTQPQISVPLVEKIIKETVMYLAEKFADNAIGLLAVALIAQAAKAFGFI